MDTTIVLVPGYTNSGPDHWQSIIERNYSNTVRVQQRDWLVPNRIEWVEELNSTISKVSGNVLLVGHSCGSVTIAQWASVYSSDKVIGALLVAPADVDAPSAIPPICVQRPLPLLPLSFPSILVCSDNDEHLSLSRAQFLATTWNSEIVIIPGAGHIHTDAGYGYWYEGERMIEKLLGYCWLKLTN